MRTFAKPASLLMTLGLLVTVSSSDAAKVKVWQQNLQSQFEKARFKHAIVTSEGALRLSRQAKMFANLQATNVWDILEDKTGNLIVATGDEGKIFKIPADGKPELLHTSSDSEVLCLVHGPDGSVFAGTGPSGKILQITSGGARVLCDDIASYVWSLVYDPDTKTIFAGTGPKGRIYQIGLDGKASVFYQTKQEHILSLAKGPGHTLYAGTDKGGLVYRIDSTGKGFVLYHAHQSEVRSLLVTPQAVYAGTSSPTRRPATNAKPASTTRAGERSEERVTRREDRGATSEYIAFVSDEDSSSSLLTPRSSLLTPNSHLLAQNAPPPSAPPVGENSIYRIAHDGTVREIFRDKVMILRMLQNGDKLLVATGMHGQLFEVDESTKEKSEVLRLDNGQIHSLIRRQDNSLVLGTGDPGKLYLLQDRYSAKGTVTSDILDAKILSKWGALNWKANTPQGTSVSVAVRSGNVSEPDDTWSAWSPEQNNPQAARAEVPTARYFQYRVSLASTQPNVSPEFRQFVLRYKTTNQAPEITTLEVPDLEAGNADNSRKLKIRWSATDPNEDELTYRLFFRKEGWKSWVLLEDEVDKKEYDWDTTTVPSGIYQLKVIASDRRDNSPEEALTAERISAPVPVAHEAPTVTIRLAGMEGDQALLEATAVDPLVRITEASFAVNGKRWANIFPTDGLFDSKSENFRFTTESLRPGSYVLMLRVKDAAGNVGSSDVLFTVRGSK